jgi:putative SOS response-associated peptidase YedK
VQSLSIAKGRQAIRQLAQVMRNTTGNLPSLPGVFPDYAAPIVRNAPDGVRELAMARWVMPTPFLPLKGRKFDPSVANVRNVASPQTRPLAFFAGIWTRWTSVRKVKEGETTN